MKLVFKTAVACTLLVVGAVADASKKSGHSHSSPTPGQFDYYVLSLSWAPEYCKTHPGDAAECGAVPQGLVLHGLWPQYGNGGYPSSCSTESLDDASRDAGKAVFPSEKLVEHEWAKHGTCSGLQPMAYFEAAGRAYQSVSVPGVLQPGKNRRTVALANLVQSLLDANPAIKRKGMALVCTGRELTEVRVCVDKELSPQACGQGVVSTCKGQTVTLLGVQ